MNEQLVVRSRMLTPALAWLSICLLTVSSWSASYAAITWDADAGTHWWFDESNWSADGNANNLLPPSDDAGAAAQDTQINMGTGAWDQGEGVVYDPMNDPNFGTADDLVYPSGFGPQIIRELYISRVTPQSNLLTIKGDLTIRDRVVIGRSSGTRDVATNGRINQVAGKVTINSAPLEIGQTDTGTNPPANGYGNGTYDYRGGVLEVGLPLGTGMRLSHGTQSNAADGLPAGTGGHGRFIMHNPAGGGYVHMSNILVASFAGVNDGVLNSADPDGLTKGVGILEFHYENGGTRPIQLDGNLSLNNGVDPTTMGTRSARLDLRINEPVTLNGNAPINLGLVDVDFLPDDFIVGVVQGTGSLGGTFSSADGVTNYPEGAIVSASFGNTTYRWNISYTGNISWTDPLISDVDQITGPGTGKDVVLIGLDSQTVAVDDADFDGDGDVDGADFLTWQRNLGSNAGQTGGDANNSGLVDAADLAIWEDQFGVTPATATVAAVPEPAVATLPFFALAGLLPLVRKHSKRPSKAPKLP